MFLSRWLHPPRRLVALFLLITLVPSLLLVAAGWRLLEQDRALSLTQLVERREQAADLAVVDLERSLVSAERVLRDPAVLRQVTQTGDDVVAVVMGAGRVEAFPEGRLTFYPKTDAGCEAPASEFAGGEELEFRRQDFAAAAAWFRRLAGSHDPAVRAGALIRLARNLRKSGSMEEALRVYSQATEMTGVAVGGIPADLLARWAACELLETELRVSRLREHALAIRQNLLAGRWRLDRASYELHLSDVDRWIGTESAALPAAGGQALAYATEWLWNRRQSLQTDARDASGRQALLFSGIPVTVVWWGNADQLSALVAGPAYVERQWVATIQTAFERQRLRLSLHDPGARMASVSGTRRAAAETRLPWTLVVEDTDPEGELARLSGRRTLWIGGLVLLAAVIAGGILVIARGVTRELAVARLQSDFVAAVSHEFRTPLTSLRQLTEILVDNRVPSDERRPIYYQALARQTERLHRLVESLLDFGTGRLSLSSTPAGTTSWDGPPMAGTSCSRATALVRWLSGVSAGLERRRPRARHAAAIGRRVALVAGSVVDRIALRVEAVEPAVGASDLGRLERCKAPGSADFHVSTLRRVAGTAALVCRWQTPPLRVVWFRGRWTLLDVRLDDWDRTGKGVSPERAGIRSVPANLARRPVDCHAREEPRRPLRLVSCRRSDQRGGAAGGRR